MKSGEGGSAGMGEMGWGAAGLGRFSSINILNYFKLLFLLTFAISRSFSPCNSRVLRWLRPPFPCSLRVPASLDPLSLWAVSSNIVLETGTYGFWDLY